MNTELFNKAEVEFSAGDYSEALRSYTDCLHDVFDMPVAGESGKLYHKIGNCLMKLDNPSEAIQSYTQALADSMYDANGTLNYNLGMAYANAHDYENAMTHFEAAATDAKYATSYKAYSAMGNSLMKLGKLAEAGVAFREAALDDKNPDPTKALLNLGVCFMALDRPADAVVSYESALQFRLSDETRNKVYANLGQAYFANGQMQKAVHAFEESLADKTYVLSDSASVDYQRAIGELAQGNTGDEDQNSQADMSGLDIINSDPVQNIDEQAYLDGETAILDIPLNSDEASDERAEEFFAPQSDTPVQWDGKFGEMAEIKKGKRIKVGVIALLIVVVLAAAAVAALFLGIGFPSQQSVAKDLFANPSNSKSLFLANMPEAKVNSLSSMVVQDTNAKIEGTNVSAFTSEAFVTAKTQQGGEIKYKVTLGREFLGWKLSNVELYFNSQN